MTRKIIDESKFRTIMLLNGKGYAVFQKLKEK